MRVPTEAELAAIAAAYLAVTRDAAPSPAPVPSLWARAGRGDDRDRSWRDAGRRA